MRLFYLALFTVTLLFLGACGSELDSPGEALRILATSLDTAFIDEPYSADIRIAGGLTPYTLEVTSGTLPPGLSLEGSTLRGVPTELGDYSFTVTVSDGRLSKTFQEYSLNVSEPPAAQLSLNVPSTEVQRPVLLRAQISEARSLQAFRTRISWDPELFVYVPESLRATRDSYTVFFEEAEGQLQVDVAILGGSLSGERNIFEFALSPLERTTLGVDIVTEFLTDTNTHAYETKFEGVTSELSDPAEPEEPGTDGAPEDDVSNEDPPEEDDPGEDPGEIPNATGPAGDSQ